VETESYETDQPHQRWCAACDAPVDVNEEGACVACVDDGATGATDAVVLEPVPETSPRSIECDHCGADPGSFCHEGEDGAGFNHAERVEAHGRELEYKAEREARELGILRPATRRGVRR